MAFTRLDRRLLAILAADVVGYSRLMEADEPGTIAHLEAIREEVVNPLIARSRGRVVKLTGDGLLVAFESVVDAVSCAIEIQRAMITRNHEVPEGKHVVFRIGINLGDVALVDSDIYGDGVNVAARLEQLCEPGGVMVSGTAYDHLQGKLDIPLDFIGNQHVKNIARPVRAYRVRLAGVGPIRLLTWPGRRWWWALAIIVLAIVLAVGAWWSWPETRTLKPAIAVLPFVDLGGGETRDRLADGITEDIINDLARFREIDVIARNSTSVYAGKPVDVRQIAENLRVKYILEGSIQRKIDRIRIAAKLIDGETGRHIWSDRWDRPAEDLFTVQSELSETVARRLASYGVIEQAELQIAKRKLPEDLGAYELFLLGLEAQHKQTKEGMDEALHLLGKAVERDPNLARAWVALGWTHAASIGFGADAEIAKKGEEEAAKRALALDPMDGEAHALMGEVYAFRGDFTRALAAFERALSLNPNNTASLMVYSLWASALGQPEQGAEAADRLIRLDPNYPVWVGHGASYAYFMVGRYEDVLRVLERIPNENLRYWELVYRAASYAVLGRTDEAKAAVAYALTRFPDLSIEGFLSNTPYSDAEQRRLIETMRQAGFPACAEDNLAGMPNAVRLPECGSKKSPT